MKTVCDGSKWAALQTFIALPRSQRNFEKLELVTTEALIEYMAVPELERNPRIRDEVVVALMDWASYLTRPYRRSQRSDADLDQVAYMGLVKAVSRFNPDLGTITQFARLKIVGEIKRHFRDLSWDAKVPRSVKELSLRLRKARDEFLSRGVSVTEAQLADALGVDVAEVREATLATEGFKSTSYDTLLSDDSNDGSLLKFLGETDHDLELVADLEAMRNELSKLSERERQILNLRFFGNLTQKEMARQLGVSQMHVSRLLTQTLEKLRKALEHEVAPKRPPTTLEKDPQPQRLEVPSAQVPRTPVGASEDEQAVLRALRYGGPLDEEDGDAVSQLACLLPQSWKADKLLLVLRKLSGAGYIDDIGDTQPTNLALTPSGDKLIYDLRL